MVGRVTRSVADPGALSVSAFGDVSVESTRRLHIKQLNYMISGRAVAEYRVRSLLAADCSSYFSSHGGVMASTPTVVVIGGGVLGLSTALELVNRGVRDVHVIERSHPGEGS